MIKKLKTRFIVLAMVSLTVLLSVIVAGMNIINYEKVVSDADARIEVLEENSGRLFGSGGGAMHQPFGGGFKEGSDSDFSLGDSYVMDEGDGTFFGRRGPGGPSMTRDEAEESRFFIVTLDGDGQVSRTDIDRISSVDASEAEEMAETALASGKDAGFVDEFRYSVTLAGLLIVFAVICYFARRIVRPVAESYEKQKRFITDAGHEIKTPLAIIKANIDLMDMELDEKRINRAELKENLSDVNDQVDRLTGLTNDLVYLSRMEEADNSLVMTEVPLSDIVAETAASFEPLAEEKGKAISTDIEPMISVQGSTKELEKLLSIIIENAIKYSIAPRVVDCGENEDGMPAPPMINVALRKEGKDAVIEVRNETEGELTNEQLAHVFERFYRMDSSRNSQTGGHGIGLSMASAIVSAHGGKISARTSSGRDFIVTASIPAQ